MNKKFDTQETQDENLGGGQRDSALLRVEASDLNTSIDASLSKSGMEDLRQESKFRRGQEVGF